VGIEFTTIESVCQRLKDNKMSYKYHKAAASAAVVVAAAISAADDDDFVSYTP
jgi:hypothetical protein